MAWRVTWEILMFIRLIVCWHPCLCAYYTVKSSHNISFKGASWCLGGSSVLKVQMSSVGDFKVNCTYVRLCVASRECNIHSTEVNSTQACRTYLLTYIIYPRPAAEQPATIIQYVKHMWNETWDKIDACCDVCCSWCKSKPAYKEIPKCAWCCPSMIQWFSDSMILKCIAQCRDLQICWKKKRSRWSAKAR